MDSIRLEEEDGQSGTNQEGVQSGTDSQGVAGSVAQANRSWAPERRGCKVGVLCYMLASPKGAERLGFRVCVPFGSASPAYSARQIGPARMTHSGLRGWRCA